MKKLTKLLLSVVALLVLSPIIVNAKSGDINTADYGTLTIEETPWDSKTGIVTQVYYITKTTAGGYVYISVQPTRNVSNIKITNTSTAFEIVSQKTNSEGVVSVLLKTKNGQAINGTKTELFTAIADGDEKIADEGCNMDPIPGAVKCAVIDGKYFDTDGKLITEDEYTAACGNTEPGEDVQTGIPVPYIAVAGGLLAIAGVYLYSRKSNKMYKI